MKRFASALGCAAMALAVPAAAQTNNDDFTPMNSRIKRGEQFPTEPRRTFDHKRTSEVGRQRSKAMIGQFTRCLYNRSNEKSLDLLEKTDFGFVAFEQIGTDSNKALRLFGFNDCLRRVADTNNSGVSLRFYAGGMRQWLLTEAYFDRYKDDADWIKPSIQVSERQFPLSGDNPAVVAAMGLADCVVASDPFNADFYFRTVAGSEDEKLALNELMPSLSKCIPADQQIEINHASLRAWLGEGLWHAASTSALIESNIPKVTQ